MSNANKGSNKVINLRYSLMKCSRRTTNSVRKIPPKDYYTYSAKEKAVSRYQADAPFTSSFIKRDDYKSRTLALSISSSRRSVKRVKANKENINAGNRTVSRIPD